MTAWLMTYAVSYSQDALSIEFDISTSEQRDKKLGALTVVLRINDNESLAEIRLSRVNHSLVCSVSPMLMAVIR